MKVHLMYRDRDFDLPPELAASVPGTRGHQQQQEEEAALRRALPRHADTLIQDLELDRLLDAMAAGDRFLLAVAKTAMFSSLTDPEEIVYRQRALADCLAHPAVVRQIYDLAVEAIVGEREHLRLWSQASADSAVRRSIRVLGLFADVLKRLRLIAEEHASAFDSEAFAALFSMLASELDDAYLAQVDARLRELRFDSGLTMSAWLGEGNRGQRYLLRRPPIRRRRRLKTLLAREAPSSLSFQIAERDQAGMRALSDLRGVGLSLVADALVKSCEHILGFFRLLRGELGFYIGCLNLDERLTQQGDRGLTSFPGPASPGALSFVASGLFDISLLLTVDGGVVTNDVAADGKSLVMITGANQGGKTTFLRSVGQAQLMMQCGMFVAAQSLRADTRSGVFTHFKREEDATMTSGKFDEELARMSEIVDDLAPDGLLLCNESFASTNEREGSQIARWLIGALRESGVKLFFVTHMYDLAQGLYSRDDGATLFLRAERHADGRRTFRLVEGGPLPTSYGEDVFKRIFGRDASAPTIAGPES
jgi:hypothetical protein